ncbi:hypothetical protein EDD18DRAFT_1108873 [Armillaria luteobubalina]|uniref:Uncharacterized protein n=1 Tax=Armillaria luteobubalina TaxID=153913 RepID=A0AA39PXM7_9AGAR|nr:hypothetical protein EDD18DRAFT_1108873 [Armillaria luteobubalina]
MSGTKAGATQEILADAATIPTQGAQNKFLSGFSLRNIENVFWNIEECDPFHSLSFDPLHAHNNGLFGDHLRGELVSQIQDLGMESVGQANDQWRNLYHFESGFMAVHFTDGTKYEDMSKCIRSYIELRMYAGFNLHTECSIQAIRDELLRFSELIRGVTRNYNTKPNEKMHGPLKDAYQLRTNFKDVAEQILRGDSWCNAASFIHQQIDLHDEQLKNPDNDELEEETSESEVSDYFEKVTLHGHHEFMIQQFEKYPNIIPKVDGEKVSFKSFKPDEKIQLHSLLKVNYENMVDWTTSTDYLRCSPDFYNHPQYDYILVDSTEHPFFAQLIMIFTCIISGKLIPLALVQPVDQPANTAMEKLDKDLGFYRVRAQKRRDSLFVLVYMTIRGALLVEDFGAKNEITPVCRSLYLKTIVVILGSI